MQSVRFGFCARASGSAANLRRRAPHPRARSPPALQLGQAAWGCRRRWRRPGGRGSRPRRSPPRATRRAAQAGAGAGARARARRAEVGRARTRRARGLLTGGARRGSRASRRGAARRHRRRSGHCTRVSVAVVVPRLSRSRLGARRVRAARQCRAPRRRGLPIAGSTTRTPCTRPREQETWKECGRVYLLQLGI